MTLNVKKISMIVSSCFNHGRDFQLTSQLHVQLEPAKKVAKKVAKTIKKSQF